MDRTIRVDIVISNMNCKFFSGHGSSYDHYTKHYTEYLGSKKLEVQKGVSGFQREKKEKKGEEVK